MPGNKRVLIRGMLQAYYWLDESIQNHMRGAGFAPLSRSQGMVMINVAGGAGRRPRQGGPLQQPGYGMHLVAIDAQRRVHNELERRLGRKVLQNLTSALLDKDWRAPLQPKTVGKAAAASKKQAPPGRLRDHRTKRDR